MNFVKDAALWNRLWSVWALLLSPFLGYGVNELQKMVLEGPTSLLSFILLIALSILGVFTRLVKQDITPKE